MKPAAHAGKYVGLECEKRASHAAVKSQRPHHESASGTYLMQCKLCDDPHSTLVDIHTPKHVDDASLVHTCAMAQVPLSQSGGR